MFYLLITLILFIALLLYFKVADRYNIIDKPNERSSHQQVTIRGGGIVFPIAFLVFGLERIVASNSILKPENYLVFGIGLLAICTISFIDDIIDLSSKIRLVFHFIAVTLLLYFVDAFQTIPLWIIPVLYVLVIGILNAYNFMDGINGMTGLYSLVVLGSLFYVNHYVISFTEENFIIFPMLSCIVFLFFNFRKKAKCFMGDIGSIGIGFWILALIGVLIVKTQELKYIFFLTVYGTEVILTILERIGLKENIFEAHRRHLYQLLVNEKGLSHLLVSFCYAAIQLCINIILLYSNLTFISNIFLIVLPSGLLYLFVKHRTKQSAARSLQKTTNNQ